MRIVAAVLFAVMLAQPALAERRLALVVGNDSYDEVSGLKKAVSDAHAMADALKPLGFEVELVDNASRSAMSRRLVDFERRLQPGRHGTLLLRRPRGRNPGRELPSPHRRSECRRGRGRPGERYRIRGARHHHTHPESRRRPRHRHPRRLSQQSVRAQPRDPRAWRRNERPCRNGGARRRLRSHVRRRQAGGARHARRRRRRPEFDLHPRR